MDGEVVVNETKNEEREASVSKSSSSCFLHHKRSSSAFDRNQDITRKNCFESKESLKHIVGSHCARGSSDHVPSDNSNASLDHRASLENDIEKLRMHLHQEKSMREMIERAICRASSTLSPGHIHFTTQKLPSTGRSYLTRTLKEHLYEMPE